MMKRYRILCLLLLVSGIANAQTIVKEFFLKDGVRADAAQSFYYRVGEKVIMERGEDVKWLDTIFIDTVKTFYTHSNKIRSRSFYQDGYEKGPYTFYHENGKVQEKGSYKESQKVGYVTRWTENGTVKQTLQHFYVEIRKLERKDSFKIINYWDESGNQLIKDGIGYCKCYLKPDGPLEEGKVVSGYRDSVWQIASGDTLVSWEKYKRGTFLEGESLYQGKRIKYSQQFVVAEFRGGIMGMMKFLQKNIRYPSGAKNAGVQGKVYVKFWVDSDGDVSNIELIRGVRKDLNKEAMRVVRISSPWIPAEYRGIPTKSTYVLPVYFKLEY